MVFWELLVQFSKRRGRILHRVQRLPLHFRSKLGAKLKKATFKSPYGLVTHKDLLPQDLVDEYAFLFFPSRVFLFSAHCSLPPAPHPSITIWFNAKTMLLGEQRVPGSEKVTCLNLSVYCSAEVATINDGRAFFLAMLLLGFHSSERSTTVSCVDSGIRL